MGSNATTIGEYLIKRLYDNGIRYIFGIPGDYVLTFYKQLEDIHLHPQGISHALQRLAGALGKRVKS